MKTVSIVIPVYNEAEILPELSRRLNTLVESMPQYRWEVVYVNDGSRDASETVLPELAQSYPWLTVLHLSRNFGHQIAISAGADFANGDAVVVMDGDLQDPPELVKQMLEKWEEGFDVVYATREYRSGETPFKLITAKLFYKFLQKLSSVYIPLDTGDFRLMSRPVVNALAQMREKSRFIRGMVSWIGFKQTPLYYRREERYSGETKYTLIKMLRFAIDGLLSFSTIPLQMITTLGFIISGISFLGILSVIYMRLFTDWPITGWSSIMVVLLMLGGIQLVCIGMIGEYVGRVFDEVRYRPLYFIRKIDSQSMFCFDYDKPPVPREVQIHQYSYSQ